MKPTFHPILFLHLEIPGMNIMMTIWCGICNLYSRARIALLSVETEPEAMTAIQKACAYGHELGFSYALHIATIPIKITPPSPQMVTAIKVGTSKNLSGEGSRNSIGT